MSILIKGMEMPKSCSECKFRIALGCCGNLPHNTRVPTCPLIELPPHGRLIDGDALKDYFWQNVDIGFYGEFMDGSESALTYKELCKGIDNAPTIIEAEGENDE